MQVVDREHGERRKVWEEIVWILGSGGIGGALLWLWEIWGDQAKWSLYSLGHLPMYIAFGAGAAVVFILLIANSDRNDRVRVVALALLSGFVWKPIWTSSQTMFPLQNVPPKESLIDEALVEAEAPSDGSSEESATTLFDVLSAAYLRSAARFVEDPEASEVEGAIGIPLGEYVEAARSNFKFTVDNEGPLIIEVDAMNSDIDLVGTLYYDSGDGMQAVDIDDDSGEGLNPRIDLDRAEAGVYLLVLRTLDADKDHRGPTRVLVMQE